MAEILWGPLSESDYQADYESAKDFLGPSWIEDRHSDLEEIDDVETLHHGNQTLIRYYDAAHQIVEGVTSFSELNSIRKQMSLEFFEFGFIIRQLTGAEIITQEGASIDSSLDDIYLRELRTTNQPESYIHELRTARLYREEGHDIALIDENSTDDPTPEFRIRNITPQVDVECRRPDPSISFHDDPDRIASQISDVFSGISGKFQHSNLGVVHVDIPSRIQLSQPTRIQLRDEIKGEIADPNRDSKITCVFLHQIGQMDPSRPPRTIIGVNIPNEDSDTLGIDWDMIPHYTEYPDGLTLLGFEFEVAASAHQIWDDSLNKELTMDPEGIRKILDEDDWELDFVCDSNLLFRNEIQQAYSVSGNRRLTFGGLSRSCGFIELADETDDRYQVKIPKEYSQFDRFHIFLGFSNEGFSVRILPVDPNVNAELFEEIVKQPRSPI